MLPDALIPLELLSSNFEFWTFEKKDLCVYLSID